MDTIFNYLAVYCTVMKKIWLLYARFGGGHLAPAKAVKEALEKKYGGLVDIKLVDIGEGLNGKAKFFLENGYSTLVNRAEWLWKIFYFLHKLRSIVWMENHLIPKLIKQYFGRLLETEKPDIIITFFHFFSPVMDALQERQLNIPVLAVVTDPFTAPPVWFYFKQISYIVFSAQAAALAMDRAIAPERMHIFPPILHPKYTTELLAAAQSIKLQLGLALERKMVLLIGGGEGLPQGAQALESLLKSEVEADFAVVCGRNERFKAQIEKIARHYPHRKIHIFGFVDFVHQLMAAADVVIAKAGASVTMEVVFLKKPIIFIHYIWEQEKGNMEFVVQNHLGFFVPKIKELPQKVQAILYDDATRQKIVQGYESVTTKNGTEAVADFIYGFQKEA